MTDRQLRGLVKKGSPRDRALLAVGLTRGEIQIIQHTLKQAVALTDVSLGYIVTANRLTPEERTQLARGALSMSRLHRRRRRADVELDRIIEQFGAEAIWRALDRYTQPSCDNVTITEIVD